VVRSTAGAVQRYSAGNVPADIEALREFIRSELLSVQDAFGALQDGQMDVTTVAPAKPRSGMRRYADGTLWNPGFGEGPYVYYGGVWHFDGDSALTTESVTTITTTTAISATSGTYLVDTTGGNITLTLPADGTTYTIKRLTGGTNTLTIDTASGNIDDAASASLSTQYESVTLKSDGTDYWVI